MRINLRLNVRPADSQQPPAILQSLTKEPLILLSTVCDAPGSSASGIRKSDHSDLWPYSSVVSVLVLSAEFRLQKTGHRLSNCKNKSFVIEPCDGKKWITTRFSHSLQSLRVSSNWTTSCAAQPCGQIGVAAPSVFLPIDRSHLPNCQIMK